MKCSKILLTGGTGFIGKELVRKLYDTDTKVYVLTRRDIKDDKNIRYIKCDLNVADETFYENFYSNYGNFDAIVYMAANIPTINDKKEDFSDAINSTLVPSVKFFQGIKQHTSKIIYISSIDVYGVPKNTDYDENESLNPFTPYAAAKLASEIYVKSIANFDKIPLTILRFSQVYGPNEPLVRIIPILLNCYRENKTFNLYGTGEEKRRFLYVKDAVQAVIKAIDSDKEGTFNIAGADNTSIRDLIEVCNKVYNIKLPINRITTSAKTFDNICNIDKSKKLLGYSPNYTLESGIKEIHYAERQK